MGLSNHQLVEIYHGIPNTVLFSALKKTEGHGIVLDKHTIEETLLLPALTFRLPCTKT